MPSVAVSKREIVTHSSEDTIARGREIGAGLKAPLLVLLSGELGAGKTTFTKGLVSGMDAAPEDEVTSPTFTLVHRYSAASPSAAVGRVYHVDLYRIGDVRDFDTLGLEDVFSEPQTVVIVEWPDRLRLRTDWPVLRISLEHVDDDTRKITLEDGPGPNL
jgi:tRNA threonylcarbamoyladenosine biosynthesis protein TsaE